MNGSPVADLGIGPESWLVLSLLSCMTFFFQFRRFWSIRNLDLVLLFVLAPGMLWLMGRGDAPPWTPFLWLFAGSALWLVRCVADLGLARRPLLEPNLNAAGLACVSVGVLGLLIAETVNLPVGHEAARNPADPHSQPEGKLDPSPPHEAPVKQVLDQAPLPRSLKNKSAPAILLRVLAGLAQLGLVAGLVAVGWRHFDRPILGLSVAACHLVLPYTRMALVDSRQLIPAALIVSALVVYLRPMAAGALIGLAAGWMPACLGLLPLWAGFYRGRGFWRFAATAFSTALVCGLLGAFVPELAAWARALGARSLGEVGAWPGIQSPGSASFWAGIDESYRLPVQIAYFAFVMIATFWPAEKNLGELIALSAALLVASQFWYLEKGGTLILLYQPLVLLMMFRPNLAAKRPVPTPRSPKVARGAFVAGG